MTRARTRTRANHKDPRTGANRRGQIKTRARGRGEDRLESMTVAVWSFAVRRVGAIHFAR